MRIALTAHLLSFAVLAGGAVGAKVLYGSLRAAIARSPAEAALLVRTMLRFSITAQIGAGLMLLSGVWLLWSEHWAFWGQGWLTAKLAIYVILVLNGPLVARPAAQRLAVALASGTAPVVAASLRRLDVFDVVQMAGLASIVILAALKPF